MHGQMQWFEQHLSLRMDPTLLLPGACRAVMVRFDYLPQHLGQPAVESGEDWRQPVWQQLADPQQAQISLYARGRDYHKVVRSRLARLADRIEQACAQAGFDTPGQRACVDSAPLMEVALARRSGLGWQGKHTLLIHRSAADQAGSFSFLGALLTTLPLPVSEPAAADGHCGSCTACISACPTNAIVAPYRVDARRCVSYLTIELDGPIPMAYRHAIGNRVYGCDDCQLACPWNRWAQPATLADFEPRQGLDRLSLVNAWQWDRARFLQIMEGSPIRRIGFERWRRNLAVVTGNALRQAGLDDALRVALRAALQQALQQLSAPDGELSRWQQLDVAEHLQWALAQQPQTQTQTQSGLEGRGLEGRGLQG